MPEKGIELFKTTNNPDEILLGLLFNCCAKVRTAQALEYGKKIWSGASFMHYGNEYIIVAVFDMFMKYGDISSAEEVFQKMKRTAIDYGRMMKYYNDHRLPMKTFHLHEKMKKKISKRI